MQKVPTVHINPVGMVKLSLGLILSIVQESHAKEICLIFSDGKLRHNNTTTFHPSIHVSLAKTSSYENTTIKEIKAKPKTQLESKDTPNKNQGQLFIQQDLFEHKGQDKEFIDTMLHKLFGEIVADIFPNYTKELEEINNSIQIKSKDSWVILNIKPYHKIDFFEKGIKKTLYDQSLSYQALKKEEIEMVKRNMHLVKVFVNENK